MKPSNKILLEVTAWILLFVLFNYIFRTQTRGTALLLSTEVTLWMLLLAKVNSRILLPQLLRPGLRFQYIFLVVVMLILTILFTKFVLLTSFNFYTFSDVHSTNIELVSRKRVNGVVVLLINVFVVFWTTVVYIYEKNAADREWLFQVQLEKKNAELKLLQTQVSPHFLFNSLNNLYSVLILQPEKSKDHVERLISLMRYLTYDQTNDKIPLKKELDFIDDYIFFQHEKDDRRYEVIQHVSVQNTHALIEPRILISFIENAFKHAYDPEGKSRIELSILQEGNDFIFEVINDCSDFENNQQKNGYFGMGLRNSEEIISFVYQDRHELVTEQTAGTYSVKLKLKDLFSYAQT